MRIHLVKRGWYRTEIFLDFDVGGISAHQKWKASLAEANSGANALLCLASPDWLASRESQVERRVAETLRDLDRRGARAALVAIFRGLTLDDLRKEGFGEDQIVDLSAAGESTLIRAELSGRSDQPGRHNDVKFNTQALEKIERSLRLIGIAPESFEWRPRDLARPSPIQASKRSRKMMPACSSAERAAWPKRSESSTVCGVATARASSPSSRHRVSANLLFSEPDCGRDSPANRASLRWSYCGPAPASCPVAKAV